MAYGAPGVASKQQGSTCRRMDMGTKPPRQEWRVDSWRDDQLTRYNRGGDLKMHERQNSIETQWVDVVPRIKSTRRNKVHANRMSCADAYVNSRTRCCAAKR